MVLIRSLVLDVSTPALPENTERALAPPASVIAPEYPVRAEAIRPLWGTDAIVRIPKKKPAFNGRFLLSAQNVMLQIRREGVFLFRFRRIPLFPRLIDVFAGGRGTKKSPPTGGDEMKDNTSNRPRLHFPAPI